MVKLKDSSPGKKNLETPKTRKIARAFRAKGEEGAPCNVKKLKSAYTGVQPERRLEKEPGKNGDFKCSRTKGRNCFGEKRFFR